MLHAEPTLSRSTQYKRQPKSHFRANAMGAVQKPLNGRGCYAKLASKGPGAQPRGHQVHLGNKFARMWRIKHGCRFSHQCRSSCHAHLSTNARRVWRDSMRHRASSPSDLAPLMRFKKPTLNTKKRRLGNAFTIDGLREIARHPNLGQPPSSCTNNFLGRVAVEACRNKRLKVLRPDIFTSVDKLLDEVFLDLEDKASSPQVCWFIGHDFPSSGVPNVQ